MDDELTSPVYPEIDRAASWYGLELDDLAAAVFLFWVVDMIVAQAHLHVWHADLTLPLSFLTTGFAFALWRSIKATQPRGFLEDVVGLLAEPEAWDLTPDTELRPLYVIEPDGRPALVPPDPSRRAFRSWMAAPLGGR